MRKFFSRLFSRTKKNDRIAAYIQRSFGFTPTDTRLYEQALRHSSAIYRGATGYDRSNERLEFLGDAVIDIIVAEYLYIKHEELSEGELTKMKAKVVSRRMLNQIGAKLGIAEELETKLGKQPIHRSMIGNAFEALIGAMYLDRGYEPTRKILLAILKANKVDERVHDVTDFKSKLHEWCQKKRKPLDFEVVRENLKGPDHERYEIVAIIDGERLGRGKGKSKKTAEQIAAKEVCNQLFGEND